MLEGTRVSALRGRKQMLAATATGFLVLTGPGESHVAWCPGRGRPTPTPELQEPPHCALQTLGTRPNACEP